MSKGNEELTTKQKLIAAALELFYKQGYEGTSIKQIIKEVGVSKGAFYHYFGSKKEVLETIAREQVEKVIEVVKEVVEDDSLNAVEKFNQLIITAQEYKNDHTEERLKAYKVFEQDGNLKLRQKLIEETLESAQPIIENIVKQGIKEGLFDTEYPEEVAKLYIQISIFIRDDMVSLISDLNENPANMEKIERKFLFYEDLLERIFGAKEGSIELASVVMEYAESALKKLID